MTIWEFENYQVFQESAAYRFEDMDGKILGFIAAADADDMQRIEKDLNDGSDPIAEGWEDGAGNTISLDGWGI